MSNLTFDEKLIRAHKPEPLEGHTVVVLERVGESGEKFHSVLEPGAEQPRQNPFAVLFGKPNVYVAYAVDASRMRSLHFTEHVQMAESVHDFELHFSLWYHVGDPQLLVTTRTSDPLGRVRQQVAEVITEEIAELPWSDVWHSFRVASESVISGTFAELKSFARDYGIAITSIRLRSQLPASALGTDKEIHEVREKGRLGRERRDLVQELRTHRSNLRREDAEPDDDRAAVARRELQNHLNMILLVLKPVVVARMLEVSPAQVTRWRQNQVPDAGTRDRLRRLSDTVSLLLQRFQPKAASDWLHAPNIHEMDGGGTPADLIRQGKWEVLRPYVEEAVSEAYG